MSAVQSQLVYSTGSAKKPDLPEHW